MNKQWGLLLGILGIWISGCQNIGPSATQPGTLNPTPLASTTTSPGLLGDPTPETAVIWERRYQQGVNQAASASSIAASAVSADDWRLVRLRWQQAIQSLQTIPDSHPRHAGAIARIGEYQNKIAKIPTLSAFQPSQTRSKSDPTQPIFSTAAPETEGIVVLPGRTPGTTLSFLSLTATDPPQVTAEAKRWMRNHPVIDVTLNHNVQFEAVLDTQASHTQITSVVAELLALPITQQVVLGNPGNQKLASQGTVSALEIGELTVSNVVVTLGDDTLKLSILGKDVLDNFKISTTEKHVKFTPR